jgi:RNA polymerase-binding transcription factor DksA
MSAGGEIMAKQPVQLTQIASQLIARAEELSARLQSVRADQARSRGPLSLDSADRAIERENDDVIDAIAEQAETELLLIRQALGRIEAGTFGRCIRCGSGISDARLRAVPYAPTCNACAASQLPARGRVADRGTQGV